MGSNIREIRHAAELRTLCSVSEECIPSEIKCFHVTAKVLVNLLLHEVKMSLTVSGMEVYSCQQICAGQASIVNVRGDFVA